MITGLREKQKFFKKLCKNNYNREWSGKLHDLQTPEPLSLPAAISCFHLFEICLLEGRRENHAGTHWLKTWLLCLEVLTWSSGNQPFLCLLPVPWEDGHVEERREIKSARKMSMKLIKRLSVGRHMLALWVVWICYCVTYIHSTWFCVRWTQNLMKTHHCINPGPELEWHVEAETRAF